MWGKGHAQNFIYNEPNSVKTIIFLYVHKKRAAKICQYFDNGFLWVVGLWVI